jgi:tRNA threonylcarbamoyl adenosine modification protein YeaZ
MSLILTVEASAGTYCVAVGKDGEILAHQEMRPTDPAFRGLAESAASTLAAAGAAIGDLGYLAVDIGPGNLNSVRASVSYVNGLAFSLDRKIFCASSLDLMAREYYRERSGPLLAVRKASGGNAYLGLYDGDGQPRRLDYGPMGPAVLAMTDGCWELAVAGDYRAETSKLLSACSVTDSLVAVPRARILYEMAAAATSESPALVTMAEPLNEGSPAFHGAVI